MSILLFILRARKIRRREEEFRERYGSAIIGTGRGPDVQVLVDSADTPAFRDYMESDKLSLISQALPKTTATLATGPLAAGGISNGLHPGVVDSRASIPAVRVSREVVNPIIVQNYYQNAISTPDKRDPKADGPIITELPNEPNESTESKQETKANALIPAYFGQSIDAERQSGGLDSSANLILAESVAPRSHEKNLRNSRLRPERRVPPPPSHIQDEAKIKSLVETLSKAGPLASSLTLEPGTRVPTPLRSCPSNPFATSPASIAAHRQALKELSLARDKGKGKAETEEDLAPPCSVEKKDGKCVHREVQEDAVTEEEGKAEGDGEMQKTHTKSTASPENEGESVKEDFYGRKESHD